MTADPDWLAVLENASAVYLGPFGYAAVEPPELAAFRQAKLEASSHPEAVRKLQGSRSPAAALYAALLSEAFGADAKRSALQSLTSRSELVCVAPGGCSPFTAPLGHFAKSLLDTGDLLRGLPSTDHVAQPPERAAADRQAAFAVGDWLRGHLGLVAAVFWALAGFAYLLWLLLR
ncbi:MAG: hypothetical protein U0263_18065 [Polyangiaceae bacterium]